MDRMTWKSSRLLSDASNYAVGVLNEGELHLTPLNGVVSLRPTFSYLDKSDKRQNNVQDDLSGEEEEEELKQVCLFSVIQLASDLIFNRGFWFFIGLP